MSILYASSLPRHEPPRQLATIMNDPLCKICIIARARARSLVPMFACTRNRARLRHIIKAINQNSGGRRTGGKNSVAMSLCLCAVRTGANVRTTHSRKNVPRYAIQSASFATPPSPTPRAACQIGGGRTQQVFRLCKPAGWCSRREFAAYQIAY